MLSTWENQTTSRVSMDNIRSSRKFAAGWLQFAHPRFVNRDDLKKWMVDQANETNVKKDCSNYLLVVFLNRIQIKQNAH